MTLTVTASDLDSGENSRLSYVVDDDRFSLEYINNTAIIKTAKWILIPQLFSIDLIKLIIFQLRLYSNNDSRYTLQCSR